MGRTAEHRRVWIRASTMLLPLCLVLASAPAALASQAPDSAGDTEALVRVSSGSVEQVAADAKYFWTWSKGRRGYSMKMGSGYVYGFNQLLSYDLDSGGQVGSTSLTHDGWAPTLMLNTTAYRGTDRVMTVDEEGGRLFLATQNRVALDNVAGGAAGTVTRGCFRPDLPQCLDGVSVIDAETLEELRHIPLLNPTVDAPIVAPQLLAMEYAPPVHGRPAKVHLLITEWAHSPSAIANQPTANPKQLTANLIYLAQFDPDAGTHDWTVPLHPCRGGIYGYDSNERDAYAGLHHQAMLFRSRAAVERAVYVGCHFDSPGLAAGVVRVPLDDQDRPVGAFTVEVPSALDDPESLGPEDPESLGSGSQDTERVTSVEGPVRVFEMLADPDSGRMVFQVVDGAPRSVVWWVFDTKVRQFVGSIGIGGPVKVGSTIAGLARHSGRLYVLADRVEDGGRTFVGGLFVADIRRTPVAQAVHYPELHSEFPAGLGSSSKSALSVQELPGHGARLWYPTTFTVSDGTTRTFRSIDDLRPLDTPPSLDDLATGRTVDLDEAEGVTAAAIDGAARAYGFRTVLVGGVEAAMRVGPLDPLGSVDQCNDSDWSGLQASASLHAGFVWNAVDQRLRGGAGGGTVGPCEVTGVEYSGACGSVNREIVFAQIGPDGPAVVDAGGSRGSAAAIAIDPSTRTDLDGPVSRCTASDWQELWGTALFGRAPAEEPSAAGALPEFSVECLSARQDPSARVGDAVSDGYSAETTCAPEEASGHAYARGASVPEVSVAEALASFRIYRDPGRGIVARVESVARGVSLAGMAAIDTVRGTAESWANGRNQPVGAADREPVYDPNCDFERTAGTCFRAHLFGASMPGWRCGPCGDEEAFVRAFNMAFNPHAIMRLRQPDARLRIGSENGYIAAIQKPEHERFADLSINADLLQTVLPTLEVIRLAAPNRVFTRQGARGRQIYQFAGVEVSSSYGIACLLVYDPETNTCAAVAEPPGSLTVSLADADGEPLAGGAFEVRQDVDADGVLGLADALLPDGACVTAEDGVGTCGFEDLAPGPYVVSQVAAPPGFAKSTEPFVVELASGEARTVAFTNVSNLSSVELQATDENGAPLVGATFAAYPDGDADGKVAPDAQPAAECTTDAQGACSMQVPAGSYVLVQTSAPGGLEGIEPVPFTFASGGQVAAVTVVNYPPESPAQPEVPAAPVYTPPTDVAPPTERIDDYVPPLTEQPEVATEPSLPEQIGGTVVQVVRAPGDAVRLLSRDPKQAVAWTAATALFFLAGLAVRRRQDLASLHSKSLYQIL